MHILVPVYVLFYTVIMRFMLLNLVLSVILDRFTDSATYEGLLSTDNFFDVSAARRVTPCSGCYAKAETLFVLDSPCLTCWCEARFNDCPEGVSLRVTSRTQDEAKVESEAEGSRNYPGFLIQRFGCGPSFGSRRHTSDPSTFFCPQSLPLAFLEHDKARTVPV